MKQPGQQQSRGPGAGADVGNSQRPGAVEACQLDGKFGCGVAAGPLPLAFEVQVDQEGVVVHGSIVKPTGRILPIHRRRPTGQRGLGLDKIDARAYTLLWRFS